MRDLLFGLAGILIIIWAIGFIGYHIGDILHILLLFAAVAILIRVFQKKKKPL